MRLRCDRRAVRGVEDAGRSGSGSHRHRPLNGGFVERKNLRRRRAVNQAENDGARVVEGNDPEPKRHAIGRSERLSHREGDGQRAGAVRHTGSPFAIVA